MVKDVHVVSLKKAEADLEIISRKKALAEGLKRYFTGKPCVKGHVHHRNAKNGQCGMCAIEASAQYRKENPEKIVELSRNWYAKNKTKRMDWVKRDRKANPEKYKERYNKWLNSDPEKTRKIRNAISLKQYHTRPEVKAKYAMRKMILRSLAAKTESTSAILGYSPKELTSHIQAQFTKGMNWENYGKWHIDHIVPIKSFFEEGCYDPKKINCLSNLRPLWADENQAKGAGRSHLI